MPLAERHRAARPSGTAVRSVEGPGLVTDDDESPRRILINNKAPSPLDVVVASPVYPGVGGEARIGPRTAGRPGSTGRPSGCSSKPSAGSSTLPCATGSGRWNAPKGGSGMKDGPDDPHRYQGSRHHRGCGPAPPAAAVRQIHPPTISSAVRLRMPSKICMPRWVARSRGRCNARPRYPHRHPPGRPDPAGARSARRNIHSIRDSLETLHCRAQQIGGDGLSPRGRWNPRPKFPGIFG